MGTIAVLSFSFICPWNNIKTSDHALHDLYCKPRVKESEVLFRFSHVLMQQSWKYRLGLEETLNLIWFQHPGCSPGCGGPFSLQVHIAGSRPAFHPQEHPSPSLQFISACYQFISKSGLISGAALTQHLDVLNFMRFL